jgi:hypothetical protein
LRSRRDQSLAQKCHPAISYGQCGPSDPASPGQQSPPPQPKLPSFSQHG